MDRNRRSRSSKDDDDDEEEDDRKPAAKPDGSDANNEIDLVDSSDDDDDDQGFVHVSRRRRGSSDSDANNAAASGTMRRRRGVANNDGVGPKPWSCPRCTLQNPSTFRTCNACLYDRSASTTGTSSSWSGSMSRGTAASSAAAAAPAAGTSNEAIIEDIDDEPSTDQQSSSISSTGAQPPGSPAAYVGGGALLGSVLGAANAYMHARPIGPGVIEGAFAGGIGGAVVNEVVRDVMTPPRQNDGRGGAQQQSNRQGAAGAAAAAAARNVNSLHVHRMGNGTGLTGTYGYTYRVGGSRPPAAATPATMNGLLRSLVGPPGYMGYADVDSMSYEQLLARYGDGTENQNRGATAGQIAALPTSTINDAEQLPVDHRSCSICLEKFASGDARKTLPCLHGFHDMCVDRWLDNSATCPVCKHPIA